ncbi:tautomerase PptA [Saccharopolyspora terrae]|uniref:Tautomerase PptA n=1 Tax=Saccharopolyspora terrae TaxID=2530384 RepID=A0A4R4VNU6_9PSEU|nr:tautomerase PptA [Saccharopolyspora terrae]TDD07538.1 tautomerase PptA [Saccharopolyspora terrae]
MPHVNIKHFPKEVTDEQKRKLAESITVALIEHLGTRDGAVSVTLEPVEKEVWNEIVVEPEINGHPELLIKRPDYLRAQG